MHPVVSGGFSSAAPTSARIRPTYARACVGRLAELARAHRPDPLVLDVGAGTGILTGQLHRARLECVAMEPRAAMAAQLRRSLPSVPVALGALEAIPLADRSVALVTAADAGDRVDASRALDEVARVLTPGGLLALVWNVRDDTVPWVAALDELVESRVGALPGADRRELDWSAAVAGRGAFEELVVESFPNPMATTVDRVLERVRSTSSVAAMPPEPRTELLAEVRGLLSSHPELSGTFEHPHRTVLQHARRR